MEIIQGNLTLKEEKIAIVASRFNHLVVDALIKGAEDALIRHGLSSDNISLVWVPGAYDMPVILDKLATTQKFQGLLALGAVIRGATYHFDIVAGGNSSGIHQVSLKHGIAIANGVLTTDTIEQAFERAGTKAGNKGFEAALALIEMINLMQQIETL